MSNPRISSIQLRITAARLRTFGKREFTMRDKEKSTKYQPKLC